MNGPGRKSLSRRVFELEAATGKGLRGVKIVFEHDLPPGEEPEFRDSWGNPSRVIVIRLDSRPAIIPEEFQNVIPGTCGYSDAGTSEPPENDPENDSGAWWEIN
jgi:hypothetical protein